jgi:CheY-like chemotaxis protein
MAGFSILLVEDHLDTQRLMSRLLQLFHHTVKTADSMQAALDLAEGEHFDMVISDLGLPDGSGLKLMQELKRKHNLPGIALTGHGSDEDIAQSQQAGIAAHLTKPIDFEQLQQIIQQVASQVGQHPTKPN